MKLLTSTKKCADEFSLLDFGLLKLCVGSVGIIAGLFVPKRGKKAVAAASAAVFGLTIVPLMVKFIRVIIREEA